MRKCVWALVALGAVPLQAEETERWELSAPKVGVRLNLQLVRDLGIRVSPRSPADKDGYGNWSVGAQGSLTALAPNSVYRTVESGELALLSGPSLAWKGDAVTLRGATVRPGLNSTFVITTRDGAPLFTADHTHITVNRDARSIRLYNMDLRLAPELAERLRDSRHAGLAVGVLEIKLTAGIPKGAVEVLDGACTTPNWGTPHNDVQLIDRNQETPFGQVARGSGVVAIAPSSELKNVGSTDVPWQVKFSPPQPPYNTDQHPYLVWNMYRLSNGAFQQIGISGLKHAFTTINEMCGCPGGSILWVNCEDTYGVGTNNSTGSLGPRQEINPRTGLWQKCGSIWDVNCDGVQNSAPAFTGATDSRRMTVLETDLQVPGATYYIDSWYIVRDDVNVYNTMGYRQVNPSFTTTWSFPAVTPLVNGPTVDVWVNPSAPGPNADNQKIAHADGHVTVAVRATDLGGGQWRYNYAVMNHDFNRKLISFSVPLPASAVVSNATFADVDRDATTDWVATATPGKSMSWAVPATTNRLTPYALKWGTMNAFSFETNVAPSAVAAMKARLGILDGGGGELTVDILGPSAP